MEVLVIDLEQIQMASEIVDRAFQLMGDIDVLVANAGIGQSANALDTKEEVEMRIFNINYHGHLAISKWVIKRMLEKGRGQVVAIGSIAGKFGQKKLAAYSASKAALIVYYESLAQELSNTPIKIQVVSPGFIQTNVTLNSLDANGNRLNKNSKAQENGMPTSVFAQKFIKAIKKKRFHQYVGEKNCSRFLCMQCFRPCFTNYFQNEHFSPQLAVGEKRRLAVGQFYGRWPKQKALGKVF